MGTREPLSPAKPRCSHCDKRERTGLGPWEHDRAWWSRPYFRAAMLRAHFPYTCGLAVKENGYWYVGGVR